MKRGAADIGEGERSKPPPPAASAPEQKVKMGLGWLAESSVLPRKQHMIEGVGAGSLVSLTAQVFRTQEQARREGGGAG